VVDPPLTGIGTPQGDLLVRIDGDQDAFIAKMTALGHTVNRPTTDDLQLIDELIIKDAGEPPFDAVRDVSAEIGAGLRSMRVKSRSLEDVYLGNVGVLHG
jgi:hypothetical protein